VWVLDATEPRAKPREEPLALHPPPEPAKQAAAEKPPAPPDDTSTKPPEPEPPKKEPPPSPRLKEEEEERYRRTLDEARALLADGRFREARFEIEALMEAHPGRREELAGDLAAIATKSKAALAGALEAARREPERARTLLAALAARAPEDVAGEARKALEEIEDRAAKEGVEKKTAEAEALAAAGKLREAADALEEAGRGMPPEERGAANARAEHWRRLARYEGAMEAGALAAVDAETLAAAEAAIEQFLETEDAEKRNALHRKLQGLKGLTPALAAAIVLRGGRFERVEAGDYVEEFTLPAGEKRQIVISVPEGYEPVGQWPLLVHLHGTNAGLEMCQAYGPYFRGLANGRFLAAQPVSARNSGWGPMKIGEQQAPAAVRFMRKKFPIDPDRVWVAGQSMGAHGTWHQAMRHGDLYAAYFPKSGSPYGAYGRNWEEYLDNLRMGPCYYIHGAQDPMFPVATPREFAKKAEERKLAVEYHEFRDSGHEGAPDDQVRLGFAWLLEKKRDAYPKFFSWTADHLDFARYSWVEATRLDSKAKLDRVQYVDQQKNPVETRMVLTNPARFTVEVKDQEIAIEAREIEKFRVWWNPAVVDLGKEVRVKVNGRAKWKGVPEASVRQMLDEARRTGRRDVVFWGSVEVDVP
jgi:hypothetical protein